MCECLNSLREQDWHFPFEQRLTFNAETMANLAAPWGGLFATPNEGG